MGNISIAPRRFGAGLVADDSAKLTAMDVSGLTVGSRCFNADVGAYFTLRLSAADAVEDEVLLVDGVNGARWVIDPPFPSVKIVDADPVDAPGDRDPNIVFSTEAGALFVYDGSAWNQVGGA
jgi:hypothetical protein